MPFLNFDGNKNKYCNLSDINFFMITNVILCQKTTFVIILTLQLQPNKTDNRYKLKLHARGTDNAVV